LVSVSRGPGPASVPMNQIVANGPGLWAGPYVGEDRHRQLAERIEGLVSQEHAKWTASHSKPRVLGRSIGSGRRSYSRPPDLSGGRPRLLAGRQ
jgi:hypothetical protein